MCLSNVLITGESNFDERNGQEMFNWSEVHSERNNFLKNPFFSRHIEWQWHGCVQAAWLYCVLMRAEITKQFVQPPSPLLSLICCRVLIIRHWARCALVGWLAILLQLSNNLVLTCPSLPTRQKKNANHQLAYQAPWMDKPFFFKFDLRFFTTKWVVHIRL